MEENNIKKCKCCGRVIPNAAKRTRYCPRCKAKTTANAVKGAGIGAAGAAIVAGLAFAGKKAIEHAPDIINTIRKIK